jgi:small-conductance mechanosensitive channel
MFGVKMELLWKIKKAIEKEGIEIPSPQRVVWFANEVKSRDIQTETPDSDLP